MIRSSLYECHVFMRYRNFTLQFFSRLNATVVKWGGQKYCGVYKAEQLMNSGDLYFSNKVRRFMINMFACCHLDSNGGHFHFLVPWCVHGSGFLLVVCFYVDFWCIKLWFWLELTYMTSGSVKFFWLTQLKKGSFLVGQNWLLCRGSCVSHCC